MWSWFEEGICLVSPLRGMPRFTFENAAYAQILSCCGWQRESCLLCLLVFHNKLFMEAVNSKFQNPLIVTVRNENDTEDMLRALFYCAGWKKHFQTANQTHIGNNHSTNCFKSYFVDRESIIMIITLHKLIVRALEMWITIP